MVSNLERWRRGDHATYSYNEEFVPVSSHTGDLFDHSGEQVKVVRGNTAKPTVKVRFDDGLVAEVYLDELVTT